MKKQRLPTVIPSTAPAPNYWNFYRQLGSLKAHSEHTLRHILSLYNPAQGEFTEGQVALYDRALAELHRRAELAPPAVLTLKAAA